MIDSFGRNIDYVRISVTDKCNLRCKYCMPEEGVPALAHNEVLGFEEIARIVKVLASLGIKKVRFTGGEPLVRKDFVKLVDMVHRTDGIEKISVTTNGVLLPSMAQKLKNVGVDSVNISLDTLKRDVFENITRRDEFDRVIEGLEKSLAVGLKVKINCVPSREFNASELACMAGLAKKYPVDVRFIELMPIGCGRDYTGLDSEEILSVLINEYGSYKTSDTIHGNGPARYVDFEGFMGSIGFISPISHKFCSECNRIRITADGKLKLCLHYKDGISLKELIRSGISDEELLEAIKNAVYHKPAAHAFEKTTERNTETDKMVQIGG